MTDTTGKRGQRPPKRTDTFEERRRRHLEQSGGFRGRNFSPRTGQGYFSRDRQVRH